MKIWLKTLLAATTGVLIGFLLNQSNGPIAESIVILSQIAIQFGRYAVFPVIFFGLVIGTHELRLSRTATKIYTRILFYLIASTALLTTVGIVSVLLLAPNPIPITITTDTDLQKIPSIVAITSAVFPINLFQGLVRDGIMLLPLVVLAIVIGSNLGFDTRATTPVIRIIDALSRIFFHINSFVVEIFWLAVIVIFAATLTTISAAELTLYRELILVVTIDIVVLYLGIFPGLLYLLGERVNPFRWLYACLGPALIGAISADSYVSFGSLLAHGRGSFGLPRMVTSAVYPMFTLFGRAGTALITGIVFLVTLRSFSSFELSVDQILLTALLTFLASFLVGITPGLGIMAMLSLMWQFSEHGVQDGYLIVQPIIPILSSAAVLLDVTTAALAAYLTGRGEPELRPVAIRNFI